MDEVTITRHDAGNRGEYRAHVKDSRHIGRLTWVLRQGVRVADHTLVPPAISAASATRICATVRIWSGGRRMERNDITVVAQDHLVAVLLAALPLDRVGVLAFECQHRRRE